MSFSGFVNSGTGLLSWHNLLAEKKSQHHSELYFNTARLFDILSHFFISFFTKHFDVNVGAKPSISCPKMKRF